MFTLEECLGVVKRKYEPTNVLRIENIAIAMSYLSIGFATSFLCTPLNVYLVHTLHVEPPMQTIIGVLQTLPWSLKLIFGFISDAFPIMDMHRKPYFTFGAMTYSFSFMFLAISPSESVVFLAACLFMATVGLIQMDVMADTMVVERSKFEKDEEKGQMQATCYSIRFGGGLTGALLGTVVCNYVSFKTIAFLNGFIPFMIVTPFLYALKERYRKKKNSDDVFTSGLDLASMVAKSQLSLNDLESIAIAAEANEKMSNGGGEGSGAGEAQETDSLLGATAKEKPAGRKIVITAADIEARIQANLEMTKMGGAAATAPDLSGEVHITQTGYGAVNGEQEFTLRRNPTEIEVVKAENDPIRKQMDEIWNTVQLKAVWRPMIFVFAYNGLQVPNVAWQSFLQLGLEFPPWVLGLTVTVGSFMTFAGVLAYKYIFFQTAWRKIYIYSAVMTTSFSLLQLLLIFQINTKYLGIHNYFFSLGDDVIQAYISGIQFLPLCVMYMKLCPEGAEGSSYAMLTTFGNIALVVGSNLGAMLSQIWDVSNEAMLRHDYSGLWKLNLLTSLTSLIPLSLLFLLPATRAEQDQLGKNKEKSRIGGICFLVVLACSLTFSCSMAAYKLYNASVAESAKGQMGGVGESYE